MRVFDRILRVAAGVEAAALGAGSALLEAMATPLSWFIPVIGALVGNAFLIWFAKTGIGTNWAWLVPAVAWFAVMVVAAGPTREGDLIANSWTGLATLAAGTAVYFAAVAGRATMLNHV